MRSSVDVIFYDGVISRPQLAQLLPMGEQGVEVRAEKQHFYTYQEMTLIGALGQIKPVIELPNEARIEFQDKELPEWLNLQHKKINHQLWRFERSPVLIALSLVLVIAVMFGVSKYGVPYASKQLAYHLPADSLNTIGQQVEQQLNEMTGSSTLPLQRQQQIRQLYVQHVGGNHPAKIVFRQGKALQANALALPNHTIILTDELVKMTKDDRELIAVLAHEQGHLVQRHSLQQAISAIGMTVFITWMTGDVSDLVSNVPYTLLSLSYSRDFERQADLYALNTLQQQHIPVHYFADFLKRMQKEDGEVDQSFEKISTHPATQQRIDMVEKFAKAQPHSIQK
jgi:Zn-dependent protease with chaperone function